MEILNLFRMSWIIIWILCHRRKKGGIINILFKVLDYHLVEASGIFVKSHPVGQLGV